MKLLLSLFVSVFATEMCQDIEQNNQELRESIQQLRSQLQALSVNPDKILQDLVSNKEKLNALVLQYSETGNKLSLASDIKFYLQMIAEDLRLLNYSPEDVPVDVIDNTIEALTQAISQARSFKENKEFSKIYNQIMQKLSESQQSVIALQIENAQFLAKLESSKAEYQSLQSLFENENNLRIIAENELQKAKLEHNNRIEVIEQAISEEEQQSRHKEIENFRKIQESQNLLISQLQSQNSEQSLVIEQLSTDKSNLENKLLVQKSTLESVQQELAARDNQLMNSESYFEDFRRKIEIENWQQIENLKQSQQYVLFRILQQELEKLQTERENLMENFNNCTQQLSQVSVEDRLKENVIKGLSNDIEHAEESIVSAKDSRSQEITILEQNIRDLQDTLKSLQEQYDQSLGKVLEQSNQIRELEEKISDYEYISQRNLRG